MSKVSISFDMDKEVEREFARRVMRWFDERDTPKNTSQSNLVSSDNPDEMATPGQIKFLRGLKYDGDPTKLSKFEASNKIKELKGDNQ